MKQKILLHIIFVFFALYCKEANQTAPGELITPQAIYTKDEPGNWAGKEDSHTPKVEILSASGKENVRVTVNLSDDSQTHYIEKIFIADSKGKPLQEKIFNNKNDGSFVEPQSSLEIPGGMSTTAAGKQWSATFTIPVTAANSKEYAVYARCSQHDLWQAPLGWN